MSTFDDLLADGDTLLGQQLGGTASAVEADGAAHAATAIVGDEEIEETESDRGRQQRRVREIAVLGDVAAVVGLGWSIVLSGETWAVESIVARSTGIVHCECVRIGTVEVSRPGYRTRGT